MKALAFLVTVNCAMVLSHKQCCPEGMINFKSGYYCATKRITSLNCTNGRILLKDVILDGNKVSTQRNPEWVVVEDPNKYCLGKIYRNQSFHELGTIPAALVCYEKKSENTDIKTFAIINFISAFFLFSATAIYIYLPELRDFQGKCYMSMCVSMALTFLFLGVLQLKLGFGGEICTATGFLFYTWMMATLFWMNVIFINIYRTASNEDYLKKTERKRYFWYSCYAWGCTIAYLAVSLITNFVEGDHRKPGINNKSCWIEGRTETWIFYYGPHAFLFTVSVILCILSYLNLWRNTRNYEDKMLNNLKQQFLLSLKLLVVIGIAWIIEVAYYVGGRSHIVWKILFIFNCLQGVIVFFLLVMIRRAIRGLTSKNCCLFITNMQAKKPSSPDNLDHTVDGLCWIPPLLRSSQTDDSQTQLSQAQE